MIGAQKLPECEKRLKTPDEIEQEKHDQEAEDLHLGTVLTAFANYEKYTFSFLRQLRGYQSILQEKHKKLLPQMDMNFNFLKVAITVNYNFIQCIIAPYLIGKPELLSENEHKEGRRVQVKLPESIKEPIITSPDDYEKVKSTLKQFVRDWSAEGQDERDRCYKPILDQLVKLFPNNRGNVKVLTPGAGLGRLSWEIAKLGFISQGNEFSFYMLLSSHFILNQVSEKNQFIIYPFINQRSNLVMRQDQLRGIRIPDVSPSDLPKDADFSMVAGDFEEVYSQQPNSWDCIVTCFFMDTAKNIFEYIETIRTALKPGGYWINFGPLLYHYEEMSEPSIELSYDELRHVITKMGFSIKEDTMKTSTYTANKRSMLQVVYKCAFFTAQKIS